MRKDLSILVFHIACWKGCNHFAIDSNNPYVENIHECELEELWGAIVQLFVRAVSVGGLRTTRLM
jgi:hypothetical protein